MDLLDLPVIWVSLVVILASSILYPVGLFILYGRCEDKNALGVKLLLTIVVSYAPAMLLLTYALFSISDVINVVEANRLFRWLLALTSGVLSSLLAILTLEFLFLGKIRLTFVNLLVFTTGLLCYFLALRDIEFIHNLIQNGLYNR